MTVLRVRHAVLVLLGVVAIPASAQTPSPAAQPAGATSCVPDPSPPEDLGSYNRVNLRAMVEELEDLCMGRPISGTPADAILLKNSQASRTLESQKPHEGMGGQSGSGGMPKP